MITPSEAKQELYEVFAQNKSGKPRKFISPYVTRVYDHEPYPANMAKPSALTVFFAGVDIESDSWIIELRLYVDGSLDAKKSQEKLAETICEIETGNTQYGGNISWIPASYTPSEWQNGWETDLVAWTSIARLLRGRETF